MKQYTCTICNAKSYSAAEIEYMTEPFCQVCGGEIKESEEVVIEELKPCPFCGGQAQIVERDVEPQGDSWYGKKMEKFVECLNCGACLFDECFHSGFCSLDEAATAWNTRK